MRALGTGLLLVAVALAGCATRRDQVILLPDAGGGVGKIAVLGSGVPTVLAEPYASAITDGRGAVDTQTLDADAVRATYARELAALPARPLQHRFYFRPDSPALTPESEDEAATILAAVAARPAVDVVLVGHSDTRGDDAHNEQLGRIRALLIRARLVALGVDGFRIRVESRGEKDLAVPTADDVLEPLNRRVDLIAR